MRCLILVIALAACSKEHKGAPAAPPGPAPVVDAPPTMPPAPAQARCAEIAARFEAALHAASGLCATAAECACYNPVAKSAGCGGVTDRATADQLSALEAEFHQASCRWPVECAAWSCAPKCVNGHCRN